MTKSEQTVRFTLEGKPKALKRPRFSFRGGPPKVYDSQTKEKKVDRSEIMKQMKELGCIRRFREPIEIQISFHMGGATKKKDLLKVGTPKATMPDIDNLAKYYLDVMNDLVYDDDRFVSALWCEKLYSVKPKVVIIISTMDKKMVNEHALTVKGEITLEDLSYLVKKANSLGKKNRKIVRCFMQEDDEGKHIYFECENLKDKRGEIS